MKLKKFLLLFVIISFSGLLYYNLSASSNGIVGWTKKTPFEPGCLCHDLDPSDSVDVFIQGPSSVRVDSSAIFKLFIVKPNLIATGWNAAAGSGQLAIIPGDTISKILPFEYPNRPDTSKELTHQRPLLANGSDTAVIEFIYKAPSTPNITDTIFANGNAVNLDGSGDEDRWNFAPIFTVNITPVSVTNHGITVSDFKLEQNYPNPFNPSTTIRFSILKTSDVTFEVFDIKGQKIASLINNELYQNGEYSISFDAGKYNLTSGVYFYKLSTSSGEVDVKKLLLVK